MSETIVSAWLQVGAVGVTALIAAVIAVWGIQSQRAISRRSATLTHLSMIGSDRDMIAARTAFITEARKPEGLTPWADPGKEYTPECDAIRLVLNDFELISVGIQMGILDYAMYQRYSRSTVIKFWYAAAPFVYAVRQQSGTKAIYHEFEELCRCFEADRPPSRKFRFLKVR